MPFHKRQLEQIGYDYGGGNYISPANIVQPCPRCGCYETNIDWENELCSACFSEMTSTIDGGSPPS